MNDNVLASKQTEAPSGEITTTLSSLLNQIRQAHGNIDSLCDRINSILGPESPPEPDQDQPVFQSSLGGLINEMIIDAEHINSKIVALT